MKYDVTFTLNSTFEDEPNPYVFKETVEAESELVAVALAAILSHVHPDDNFLGVTVEPEAEPDVEVIDWTVTITFDNGKGIQTVVPASNKELAILVATHSLTMNRKLDTIPIKGIEVLPYRITNPKKR